jgi:hypothetical protein
MRGSKVPAQLVAAAMSVSPMTSLAEGPFDASCAPHLYSFRCGIDRLDYTPSSTDAFVDHDNDSVVFSSVFNTYYLLELGREDDGSAKIVVQSWRSAWTADPRSGGEGRINIADRVFFAGYIHVDPLSGEVMFSHATDVLISDLAPERAPSESTVSPMHRSTVKYRHAGDLTQLTFSLEGGLKHNIAAMEKAQVVLDAFAGFERAIIPIAQWGPTFSTHLAVDVW